MNESQSKRSKWHIKLQKLQSYYINLHINRHTYTLCTYKHTHVYVDPKNNYNNYKVIAQTQTWTNTHTCAHKIQRYIYTWIRLCIHTQTNISPERETEIAKESQNKSKTFWLTHKNKYNMFYRIPLKLL